jgi:cell division protein FtsN
MGKRSRSQGRGAVHDMACTLFWYLILALSRITIQKKYKVKEAKSYILK